MILSGILMLICIYILWKMFIDGWLFKIILFFAGWVGLYVICRVYMESGKDVAFTMGNHGNTISWAAVVPTVVCLMCLLCTKVKE